MAVFLTWMKLISCRPMEYNITGGEWHNSFSGTGLFILFCWREDDWLTAALDCLEFLPDQQVVEVSRDLPRCPDVVGVGQGQPCCSGSGTQQCKLLLYETLVKYYGQPDRSPLLANHMSDIYTGVTELLGETGAVTTSYYLLWLALSTFFFTVSKSIISNV